MVTYWQLGGNPSTLRGGVEGGTCLVQTKSLPVLAGQTGEWSLEEYNNRFAGGDVPQLIFK